MKKQLLLLSALVFTTVGTINAQQRVVIAKKDLLNKSQQVSNTHALVAGPTQLTGGMLSTGYVAGSNNYVLDMVLVVNNQDAEYGDSLSITFPTGITPVSSPNTTFPSAVTTASLLEQYNGVSGQRISWGNDDNVFGGITGYPLNFQVLVNVTPGLTGVKTGTFHLSGDGYVAQGSGTTPGALNGTFVINEKTANDFKLVNISVPNDRCDNSATEQIGAWFRNEGTAAATTFTLMYTINTGMPVMETYTGSPIAPNDTLKYTFTTPANLSAPGNYTITTMAMIAGDVTANHTYSVATATYGKKTMPYSTSFENTQNDLENWKVMQGIPSNNSWITYTVTPHSGVQTLALGTSTATPSNDWITSPCLNLQTGITYFVRLWKKAYTGSAGNLGVFLGTDNTIAAMTQTITPSTALTLNSTWVKDSVTFTVASNGVYYLGLQVKNTTTPGVLVFIDDLTIADVLNPPTGINSVEADELSVYPNPTTGLLNVYSPNSYLTVEIYNTIGQNVLTTKTTTMGNNQVDVSTLPMGAYTVKLSNDRNLIYKRIVVQK